ncbi:MAG: C10 family peptidase [Muribaculaceae bacterium]|nr:C10 family peptidase [Muribaculaceae bacterium]
MSKFRLFLLLTVCAFVSVSMEMRAEQVGEAQARSIAARFMAQKNLGTVAAAAPKKLRGKVTELPALYVFNAEKDRGFVIVSGDDRTEQILGYCDKGRFDPDNVPENMQAWLDQYVEEIAMLDAGIIKLDEVATTDGVPKASSVIAPLMKSQWDQTAPFNFQCPQDDGTYCYSGCTATALAQIMYYHKWPTSTSKTIPGYTQTGESYSMNGTTYNALPTTTFDWNAMKDYYEITETSTTSAANAAVAKLVHYCGKAMQMKYGTGSSGATPYAEVLVDYFRYSPKARKLYRFDYSYYQWQNTILAELRAHRPVLYVGMKHSGGHTFVCDGYDGNGFFHFNWGWRGMNDGYFVLSALNPKSGGAGSIDGNNGYMMHQYILIGLEPNTVSTSEKNSTTQGYSMRTESTTYTRSSSSDPFVINVSSSHYNESLVTRTYNLGYGVYKSNGFDLYQTYSNQATNVTLESKKTYSYTRTLNFGKNFSNGTYYLRALSCETGSSAQYSCYYSGHNFFKAVVNGNTLTLTPVNIGSGTTEGVTVSLTSSSSMRRVNRPLEIKVKVTNNNFFDYVPVYLFVNDKAMGANSISLSQGQSGYVTISYTPTTAGTNSLKFTADANGNNVYCTGSVYVENGAAADLTMSYSLPGSNSSYQVPGILTFNVGVKNNNTAAYNDYIVAGLYKRHGTTNKYSLISTVSNVVNIPGSTTKNVQFNFADLEPAKYFAVFYYYNVNEKVEAKRTVAVEVMMKGDVNADGTVTAADITALYDFLLNGTMSNLKLGDQNGDGDITAADVTAVYDVMLGN